MNVTDNDNTLSVAEGALTCSVWTIWYIAYVFREFFVAVIIREVLLVEAIKKLLAAVKKTIDSGYVEKSGSGSAQLTG